MKKRLGYYNQIKNPVKIKQNNQRKYEDDT